MTPDPEPHAPSLKERARHELRDYAIVAAYLFVCFGTIVLYKSALLREAGLNPLPSGIAAIKALILGKFILIGEAAGVGTRIRPRALLLAVAWKSVLFFLMLVVLSVTEELLVGRVHGHSFAQTLAEYEQRSVLELIASCLLLLLVLIPLIAAKEFSSALGPVVLARLLSGSEQSNVG